MIYVKALWAFLTGNLWRTAAIGIAIALLVTTAQRDDVRDQLANCRLARQLDTTEVERAAAESHAEDLQHALNVERTNQRIAQEKQHELEGQLAAARGAVARYVGLQRDARSDLGSPAGAGGPEASDTPRDPARTGETALVPVEDLEVCAENTVKAEGWQDWWREVSQGKPDTGGR